jgi:acetyl-CoA C-acetyltransferase
MQTSDPIVVVSYARTPIGALLGSLASVTAPKLASQAISAAIERAKLNTADIEEAIIGCVLPAGLGQAPARQAALGAKLSDSTVCATINKVCGSGMKAIMLAHDSLLLNEDRQSIVAGGMESMSNAPYYLEKARAGYRMGNSQLFDHMLVDGLEDAYQRGKSMGVFADETATELNISRAEQDEFTTRSLLLAQQSIKDNLFSHEITPITITTKTGTETISQDEIPLKLKAEKIPQLKPAFNPNGSVTAANSSSIADGAAALILMRLSTANKLGIKPIAKILGQTSASQEPRWFTTAPVLAMQKLFKKLNLTPAQIDLFEINEAFAVVTLAAIKQLQLDINKVNIRGGACALGHPIGASGARIVCTLLSALQSSNKKLGVASLCIGGGEATAMAFEMI